MTGIRVRLVRVLEAAGEPLSASEVYERLESEGDAPSWYNVQRQLSRLARKSILERSQRVTRQREPPAYAFKFYVYSLRKPSIRAFGYKRPRA